MDHLRRALAPFAVVLAFLLAAHGHGSVFPPGVPPDNSGKPPRRPGDSAGPPVPRPGQPAGPGTGAGSPGAPGGNPGLPAGDSGAGPGTGGSTDLDLSSWQWWWEFNKEPYLAVRAHQRTAGVESGSDGFYLGRGRRVRRARADRRPTEVQVVEQILPALQAALAARDSNDMVTGALLGIARIGNDRPGPERAALETAILPHLQEPNRQLAEIAALALGLLGHDPSVLVLGELVLDTESGRRAAGAHEVPVRLRAFAAYGLGILGARTENEDVRRYAVHALRRALEGAGTASPDLAVACASALGRIPLTWSGAADPGAAPIASSGREGQIAFLRGIVGDENAHRFVRAAAATSLAFLLVAPGEGCPAALAAEVGEEIREDLATRRKVPRELRQSAAIALGILADGDGDPFDARARRALFAAAREAGDEGTRRFALISLSRVAVRPGRGEAVEAEAVRTEILRFLGGGGAETRRWAALALALLERGRGAGEAVPAPAVVQALHICTADANAPADCGAFATATGLLGDPSGVDELFLQLGAQDEEVARGYVAVALGLLQVPSALAPLQEVAQEATYQPWLLRGAAIALGMLGDPDVVDVLLEKLAASQSISAQASIAQALGRIGDDRTVEPLLALLTDARGTSGSRAFAAVALGLVADEDLLPWTTLYAVDANYRAAPPTLYDPEGLGLLNFL
ncbi:MAG: HEAT repeat domain-containing protein [Planctomycetota bacterium]